jgi:hypothetical protein
MSKKPISFSRPDVKLSKDVVKDDSFVAGAPDFSSQPKKGVGLTLCKKTENILGLLANKYKTSKSEAFLIMAHLTLENVDDFTNFYSSSNDTMGPHYNRTYYFTDEINSSFGKLQESLSDKGIAYSSKSRVIRIALVFLADKIGLPKGNI